MPRCEIGIKGVHANQVFSCQQIPHDKNFLHLHLADDGTLTMYPMGIESVEPNGSLRPDGKPQDPWFEGDGELANRVELVEPPLTV